MFMFRYRREQRALDPRSYALLPHILPIEALFAGLRLRKGYKGLNKGSKRAQIGQERRLGFHARSNRKRAYAGTTE
jgi:hypothetical protein